MGMFSLGRPFLPYRTIYAAGIGGYLLVAAIAAWFGFTQPSWVALLISLGLIGFLGFLVRSRWKEFRSLRHLAGPRPSFLLGNLEQLLAHGHGGRERALADLHAEFGPVVRLHLAWGSTPFVSLSYASPNLHRRELDSYRRADRTMLPRSLMGMAMDERHRAHRQAISPSLTSRAVTERVAVLEDVSAHYVDKWKREPETSDELRSDLRDWSISCLSAFLFGDDWDTATDLARYHRALSTIEEEVSFRTFHPFFVRWLFPRRLIRAKAAYRYVAALLGAVTRRRESRIPASCPGHERPTDLLDELRNARHAANGKPWSSTDRIEELMSLILGGTDPLAYVVSQALVLLSLNPRVQEKARDHVRLGSADPFVRDIVHETLRLHPAVPFSAKFPRDLAVTEMGATIPPGTAIMWTKSLVGRNQRVFADANRFDPERFSAGDGGGVSVSSFLPFGAGPRHCVGSHLAEQQCVVLLTQILRHFRIDPVPDVEMKFHTTISVIPSTVPVKLVAA